MKKSAELPWSGRKVLITAGPTREPLDPIRFLTNASTGMMGFSLARAARDLGAKVTVVSGPCQITSSWGIQVIPVVTAQEMHRKVLAHFKKADVVIAAAAVGDWRFDKVSAKKVKKTGSPLRITLLPNPDIIADVSGRVRHAENGNGSRPVLVGFALETDHRLTHAKEKLSRKGLDMIIANGPDSLGLNRSRVAIIECNGAVHHLPTMGKPGVAREILKRIERYF